MCSAFKRNQTRGCRTATSTIRRSAPRPERSTRSAISAPSAWVTVAPSSHGELVASVSWPGGCRDQEGIVQVLLSYSLAG